MAFQSSNKHLAVKAVLISAASSSGKTHLLKHVSGSEPLRGVTFFEMDSLKYYKKNQMLQQLPMAYERYFEWYNAEEKTNELEEIHSNIQSSIEDIQLIKMTYIELMLKAEKFVTVVPRHMRRTEHAIRFFELIEVYFNCRITQLAIIPSLPRYILNLYHRKFLTNFRYIKDNLSERKMLMSEEQLFDCVIKTSLSKQKNLEAFKSLGNIINQTPVARAQ